MYFIYSVSSWLEQQKEEIFYKKETENDIYEIKLHMIEQKINIKWLQNKNRHSVTNTMQFLVKRKMQYGPK